MKFLLYVFLLASTFSGIFAEEKPYIELHCRDRAGLFSIFHDILGMLKYYDKGLYQGIEINFEKEGQYYSPEYGDNWFNYYCEPIRFGERKNVLRLYGNAPGVRDCEIEKLTTRHEAKYLIDKYIRFKPHILERIEQFEIEHLVGHYVIGVHYRGTDKFIEEAPFVSYHAVVQAIKKRIKSLRNEAYKIFVATDEQDLINYLEHSFGNKVCYTDSIRSIDGIPLHFSNHDRYQCGEDAIVDAVLLSRGQYLIRTSSNLSRWSTFFNPDIPVKELSQLKF